jgi:hypothetical protein
MLCLVFRPSRRPVNFGGVAQGDSDI